MSDSLLELHDRAVTLARAPGLEGLDAETLLSLAEEVTEVVFEPGAALGEDGAAYVTAAGIVRPGERQVAGEATRALRLEADRWLDLTEELALP